MPKKSRAQKSSRVCAVPDGEREHAAQAVEHGLAPGEVAREQHLRVRMGLERPALGLQVGAQVLVVVDLAVEHDGEVALRGRGFRAGHGGAAAQGGRGDARFVLASRAHHGLVAALEVDERQAAVPERDAVVEVLPLAVGPAVRHDVAHGLQRGQIGLDGPGEPADSAHNETLLLVSYAPMIAQRGETPKRRLAISPKPQIPTDCPARAARCTFCQNVPTTGGFVGIMMHPGRERASFGMNARLVGLLLWRPSRAASRPACVDPRGTNRLPEVF